MLSASQQAGRPRIAAREAKRMVKNGYFLVWLALLVSGITAASSRAQTLPDLQTQLNVNDNFLLARA